jgi:hypothetical protein
MSAAQTTDRNTYPVCITRPGGRDRPRRVERLANGYWRVDWVSQLVTLYNGDPRHHLALGYEPERRS